MYYIIFRIVIIFQCHFTALSVHPIRIAAVITDELKVLVRDMLVYASTNCSALEIEKFLLFLPWVIFER
jgi:hypothetical protein